MCSDNENKSVLHKCFVKIFIFFISVEDQFCCRLRFRLSVQVYVCNVHSCVCLWVMVRGQLRLKYDPAAISVCPETINYTHVFHVRVLTIPGHCVGIMGPTVSGKTLLKQVAPTHCQCHAFKNYLPCNCDLLFGT